MRNIKHTLWIEKYRVTNIDDYIDSNSIKEKIKEYINNNDIPHLLLSGPAGTGKTTLAKLLKENIECDYIYINASDENGIDTIREKVKGFASSATFKKLKIVILDEADFLTQPAQASLRFLIEEYSIQTRFILTCNYIEKLIAPIQSRCELIKLNSPSKKEIARFLVETIFKNEEVNYDIKDVVLLINKYYPDVRAIIKIAQSCTKQKVFTFNNSKEINNWLLELLELLKNRKQSMWYDIRQLVANEQIEDFQEAYSFMFDNLKEFSNGNDAEISIILDEYMWRANVSPDKEINFAACIAKIYPFLQKQIIK